MGKEAFKNYIVPPTPDDLTVEAINQRGEISAYGTAVVALPSREFGPVSLPLGAAG